ncbi:hypothetical protein [Hyphomicrobium sp.]|uniref:hypothetical protein n=1 Tax=Hyphomicrobium sp. TaxID=82 RepID=UPI0025BC3E9D|nr:hypothetical protein [Hyphomicrobium sp.]MCC7253673.1 hypothetical protein [Hyphomicrobium sp.]
MKIAAFAISAALLGFASVTPASALPSTPGKAIQSDSVQLVQNKPGYKGDGYGRKGGKHDGHRHNYRPGGRYAKAPRGWKRHYKRPSYWQTRGCIVVGPVWFCP